MGILVNGKWHKEDTLKSVKGAFKREGSQFHHWITPEGKTGTKVKDPFKAESGRYHLYVSLACPWAHRTLIFRTLKQLEPHISCSVVSPDMLEHGWSFNQDEGSTGDPVNHFNYLHQVYTADTPRYTGRVTVPVLWDKENQCIVNNESSEIIRIFNQAFNAITGNQDDYYPDKLQQEIDTINTYIYNNINNGVYRCGFATTQAAYEVAYTELFEAIEYIENRLANQRYLAGNIITEADWRLFPTLIRFDAVYYGHFKCNKKRIEDHPHLANYLRELYQWPGIAQTVDFHHIKRHYYFSQTRINPTQIVPAGPVLSFNQPHNRGETMVNS